MVALNTDTQTPRHTSDCQRFGSFRTALCLGVFVVNGTSPKFHSRRDTDLCSMQRVRAVTTGRRSRQMTKCTGRCAALVLLMCAAACGGGGNGAAPADSKAAARLACRFEAGALPEETLGPELPRGSEIPIEHIIVLMQENRSFDTTSGGCRRLGSAQSMVYPFMPATRTATAHRCLRSIRIAIAPPTPITPGPEVTSSSATAETSPS